MHPGEPVPGTAHRDPDGWSRPEEIIFTDGKDTIHEQIGMLNNLRSLTTSPAILELETFQAISRLPCLETLVIQSTGDGGPSWGDYGLSDDSFPALRTLQLIHLDPRNTEHLCSLEPLVQRLTHASLIFDDCGDDIVVWDYHGSRSDIIRSFMSRCRELTSLSIKMGDNNAGFEMCPRTIDMLRLLPIRHFEVDMVDLEPGVTPTQMLDALPCVEVLRLSCTMVGHQFLRHAAVKLPRLRSLELGSIEFEGVDEGPSSEEFAKPPNQSQRPLSIQAEFNLDNYSYEDVARYLYALWPNVTAKSMWDGLRVRSSLFEPVRRINRILSTLKQAAG
ncbi:hypothetical protein FRC08_000360 [Ceratobasidium sp. 394]|nr:hypothetical protein FRC08_000360 [Ceratobasidium sp. 394]